MSKNSKSDTGNASQLLLVIAMFGMLLFLWAMRVQEDIPVVLSMKDLASRTIRDEAAKRCFTVFQQDGQPRFVPADCPKGK